MPDRGREPKRPFDCGDRDSSRMPNDRHLRRAAVLSGEAHINRIPAVGNEELRAEAMRIATSNREHSLDMEPPLNV